MIRNLATILVCLTLIAAPACAAPGHGKYPATWTSDAQYAAGAWDTTHAGAAMPSHAGWANPFHETWGGGASCPTIVPQLFQGFASVDTTAPPHWFGNNTVTGLSCATGKLVFTQQYTAGAWTGLGIGTRSFNYSGYAQSIGYYEVSAILPAPATGNWPWVAILWENARNVGSPIPYPFTEMDQCETGLQNNGNTYVTHHIWPRTNSVLNPTGPGQVTAHAFHQLPPTTICAIQDGLTHVYSILETHNYTIVGLDGLELGRFPKLNDDTRQPQAMLISVNQPTFATDTTKTYVVTINSADAFIPPAGLCYTANC